MIEEIICRFNKYFNKIDKTNLMGCWIWSGYKDSLGYGVFTYKTVRYKAHRIMFLLYNFSKIKTMKTFFVCHTCDNPSCVNPNHLYLGTAKDNSKDREDRNRGIRGNKIPDETVLTIFEDPREERDICLAYGVSKGTVHNIKHRKYRFSAVVPDPKWFKKKGKQC